MEAGFGSIIVLVVSIFVLIFSVMKLKVHPVYALILVGIGSAFAFGFPIEEIISTVTGGFGGTIGNIGIVIILGCTIGVILEETGGALVLANTILKLVGRSHSGLAMAICGYLVSIPVFSDSAIVILSPVAQSLSARSGIAFISVMGALNAGIMATHTMVPPTPGPLAAAGTLGADLGLVIFCGLISSAFYTAAGMFVCRSKFMVKRHPNPFKLENVEAMVGDDFEIKTDKKLPNAGLTFACILVPVLLICINSFATMFMAEGAPILKVLGFIGNPIPALFIGVLLSLFLDTSIFSADQVYKWFDRAVESSGFIILATGAAGAFGAVLKASGVGTFLGEMIAATPLPAVFVPYLVALLLSVSNGSATVALTTGSAIVLPLIESLGLHPVIATLAVAAGAGFCYHTNASHFWVVQKTNKLTMAESFDTVTWPMGVGSVCAIIAIWIMSIFLHP